MDQPKFDLGNIVATPGAIAAMARTEGKAVEFLSRHRSGDWGMMPEEDKKLNDQAIKDGERLMSAYALKDGTKIWVITECDRSVTTILLPEEY